METAKVERPIMRPRKRWLAAFLFACVFLLSGLVIGSSLTFYVLMNQFIDGVHNPEILPERIASKMRFGLGLSDEQATEVEAILRERLEEMLKTRAEIQPRIRAELELMRKDIKATLTPAQAETFEDRFDTFIQTFFPLPASQE